MTTTVNASYQSHYKQRLLSPITKSEVIHAQQEWATGLVHIGKVYKSGKNYTKTAKKLIAKLYAYNYGKGTVMFKPTKAAEHPFRNTPKTALSYFVGGNANYDEDKGFALAPWKHIKFHNDEMYLHGDIAIVMGEYVFTNTKGEKAKVEYTFGYVKAHTGDLKIILHHSSMPYSE